MNTFQLFLFGAMMFLMILTPTILFISLTIYQFEKGENKRIEADSDRRPNTAFTGFMFLGLLFNVVLIAINIIVMFEVVSGDIVPTAYYTTILWTFVGWVPTLILLFYFRDKGLKYRKWIITFWIMNFLVFFTGMMNPIPQSV